MRTRRQGGIARPGPVAEHRGIIVVPEEPYTQLWKGYVLGKPEADKMLLQMAHDRREAFEKTGTYF